MSKSRKTAQVTSVLAFLFLSNGVPANAAAAKANRLRKPLNAVDSAAVERARSGAARKLESPECLKVLTDFKDREGGMLETSLETWGLSAADYVRTISFRDGGPISHCQRSTVYLATVPGFPVVYLCPATFGTLTSRFARMQFERPALAEVMVIHEMLHTLGLGENPPSTFDITEQVIKRCH